MATVTDQVCGLDDNKCRFYVTYDDVTGRIQSMRVENDETTRTCTMTAFNQGTSERISFTAQPGQYGTYTLKNNERYFYNDWSTNFELS